MQGCGERDSKNVGTNLFVTLLKHAYHLTRTQVLACCSWYSGTPQRGHAQHAGKIQTILLVLAYFCGAFKLSGCVCRLHTVHDEEKPFELEMAWICDDSKKQFVKVPADLLAEADKAAKDALNSDM